MSTLHLDFLLKQWFPSLIIIFAPNFKNYTFKKYGYQDAISGNSDSVSLRKDLGIQLPQVESPSAIPDLKTTVVKVLLTLECAYNSPGLLLKCRF